eukprot:Blabericola_migrator_1__10402@NODE_587_length_7461_cov_69_370571_g434_i0_p1_GENE_NODE_587_length_7461_cov_69_370571_g434_i0NODE_587_length_7461_cov_69_370571_g434_i0_p1_ORF_typecomplete_len554_score139_59tRNA_synthFbeta/PF17759_1/6_7e32B3_4/PF03483_17/2e27B5/PF03484_15/4B5/PF03484_15/3_2e14PhetRS_B1/PF18262_1/2_1e16PhetRS_B1/PF18262_1/1_3e03_NODE_587_length_7461_cov_69_370571_g434_i037855446
MPTVIVDAIDLNSRLSETLELPKELDLPRLEKVIDDICFELGLEYDGLDEEESTKRLRIEVPANRYDLLCIESITHALKYYKSPKPLPFPVYRHSITTPTCALNIHASVKEVRPYALAAIFRNVKLDEAAFRSFIDLQDKLHQNIGRRRTLVAIGTHNLDVIQGTQYSYQALPQKGGFKFVPLTQTEEVDGEGMFRLLENTYIKPYLHITRGSPLCPVILDEAGNVLSVPPIINSEFSKMSASTTNIFVDITATDLRKAEIALDVITAALSERLAEPMTVEPVKIVYQEEHPGILVRRGEKKGTYIHETIAPTLKTEKFKVSLKYIKTVTGIPGLTMEKTLEVIPKMMLRGVKIDEDLMEIECPITRRDVLHPCDIAEDVAIAYGYNNIAAHVSTAVTLQNANNLADQCRKVLSMAGWRECLTFGLISIKDAYADLRRQQGTDICDPKLTATYYSAYSVPAIVSEPKTRDFECVRPSLIPGILKTLSSNQASELPIKLYEIGDCVTQYGKADNRILQRRHIAALIADHNRTGLEEIHGLLDLLMKSLGASPVW